MTTYERRRSTSPRPLSRDAHVADEVLLGRVADGDHGALTAIYDRHAEAVYGLALQMLTEPGRAESATLDVFASAWRTAGTFDPSLGSAHTWLLTATHRLAVDLLRADHGTPDDGSWWERLPWPRQPLTHPLAALTPHQQISIHLAYFGGLTSSQIATAQGVPSATVQRRMLTGLRALARKSGQAPA